MGSLKNKNCAGVRAIATAVLLPMLVVPCLAAEYSSYAALTSNYVHRGVTQSDNNPAIQLGIDANFDSGLFTGAWGSTVDIGFGSIRNRDIELNIYGGYAHDFSARWTVAVQVVAYAYPGQTSLIDYNYEEYSLLANYDDHFWLEFAYSPDLYHTGFSTTNIELFSERPLNGSWSLSGGVGHYNTAGLSGRSYTYWQLGVTRAMRWADIDFRYHDTNTWVSFVSSPQRTGAQFAVKLLIPF